jgi:putative NIF3 family GTP cyclohydrolase 1 type 2
MQFHGVLEMVEKGSTVILSEHTLTERKYIKTIFYEKVLNLFADREVSVHTLSSDEEIIKLI